ncbi:hypothetical protein L596_003931 [Steinernema carpocapsae]|uniref:Uncharacterized protein n=1 Tax=Steinernema carpocapsae TaxID=34508 RepID=A0A4U8UVQ7_STECR|nr:hypothetical protein L596_003931 [Steinernema carpocapsae]
MAFIVPVMKKDYMLYQKRSSPASSSSSSRQKLRSTSNPILIPSRNSTSTSRPTSSSVDSVIRPSRRAQRQRVSIRRISDSDNDRTSGNERHVHFGVLEEIMYDELEEAFEDSPADVNSESSSLESRESPLQSSLFPDQIKKSNPVAIGQKKRGDESPKFLSSNAPILSNIATSPSKMQNVFKLVALCSPKN